MTENALSNSTSGRFLFSEPPAYLKRPMLRIQPILAREGKPSVDVDKLADLIGDCATLEPLVCIHSPEQWAELVENLPEEIDAILPVSSPCYPTEIWNSHPQPLQKRGLPIVFWSLIEHDEPDFWKWSACDFLRALGIETHLVKSNAQGKTLLKALAMRRFLRQSRLVVFGEQNFPWNATAGGPLIKASLGTEIVVKPLSAFRQYYERFSDAEVEEFWKQRSGRYVAVSVLEPELRHAVRIYLAIRTVLEEEQALGFGVNCFGDLITGGGRDVPCLAQCLAREDGYIASCDGDYCAMMSMVFATYFLDQPCMMSNLYPLSYVGALEEHFGDRLAAAEKYADMSTDLARLAHCGFVGVVSPEMAPEGRVALHDWGGTYEMKRDGKGCGIDGDLAAGQEFTGVELHFDGKNVLLATGEVLETTRHPGMPHCESSALLRIGGLANFVENISREHVVLVYGSYVEELTLLFDVLGLKTTIARP